MTFGDPKYYAEQLKMACIDSDRYSELLEEIRNGDYSKGHFPSIVWDFSTEELVLDESWCIHNCFVIKHGDDIERII